MEEQQVADLIQIRRDTASNWTSANPTLAQGELGIETDTSKIKVGDGSTAWNSKTYLVDVGSYITASSTDTLTNKTIAFASNTLTDVAGTTASQTITNKNIVDKVYTLTGTVIDPDNGSIQNKTLSSAPTFTQSISAGESVILQLINAAYYTVTWPTITWISTAGNVAPTFTSDARETVVLWSPESGTICGAYLGNAKT
jgi:hypothetical protein|tara:strand:- start:176 stop:772 length:597 start_codon:yes stop_codon:yes gene_type:complete